MRLEKEEKIRKDAEVRRKVDEETRRKIEHAAKQKQLKEESVKREIEERSRSEREHIERQSQASQQSIQEMKDAIQRQKEETLRMMEQERRDRERRELLRKEHNQSLAKGPSRPAPRPVVRAPERPKQRTEGGRLGRPFISEDDTDEAILQEYMSRTAPDPSLPKVPFLKRNGTYWLGQRRCDAVVEGGQVVIKWGRTSEEFLPWLEKAERVEALRLKGLTSAMTIMTLQQGLSSRVVAVKVAHT